MNESQSPLTPQDLVELAKEITPEDRNLIQPPADLWDRIAAAVALEGDGIEARNALNEPVDEPSKRFNETVELRSTMGRLGTTQTNVRQTPRWLPAAAALLLAIGGGIITFAFSSLPSTDGNLVATAVISAENLPMVSQSSAEAETEADTDSDQAGQARLFNVEGDYHLDLEVPELPSGNDGSFYEVWILGQDDNRMYSLGFLTGDGRFALPPGVDPGDFPVVDISIEPNDGDPTHSGTSLWRGSFDLS